MPDYEFGKNREEKIDIFLDKLAWYFSSKPAMDYTASAVEKLTVAIKSADESSTKLATALNRLTSAAVIIAFLAFVLEVVKLVFGL